MQRVLFIFGYEASGAEAISFKISWGMRAGSSCVTALTGWNPAEGGPGGEVPGLSETKGWLGSGRRPQTRTISLPGHASVLGNH